MWPHLGHIEDVPLVALGFRGIHDLNKDIPRRVVSSVNGLKHVPNHVIGVLAGNLCRLFPSEVLHALTRLHMDLYVFERTILIRPVSR